MMIAVCVCALRAGSVSDGQVENKELGRAGGGNPLILVLITIAVCVCALRAGRVSDGQVENKELGERGAEAL